MPESERLRVQPVPSILKMFHSNLLLNMFNSCIINSCIFQPFTTNIYFMSNPTLYIKCCTFKHRKTMNDIKSVVSEQTLVCVEGKEIQRNTTRTSISWSFKCSFQHVSHSYKGRTTSVCKSCTWKAVTASLHPVQIRQWITQYHIIHTVSLVYQLVGMVLRCVSV